MRLPALALGLLLLSPAAGRAGVFVLYDPALGTLPAAQPWLAYANDALLSGGSASQTLVPGQGVRLTTDAAVSAGYSNYRPLPPVPKNPAFPALDRAAGFALEWTLRVDDEAHSSNNRAGFSVILLSADGQGIELGFWEDSVWAQGAGFVRAESAAFDTTATTDYRLAVAGNDYQLSADGALLLSGQLRSYPTPVVPYQLPSFVFLGDDTSSAGADIVLGQVTLFTAVPEPSGLSLAAAAVGAVRLRRRLRRAVA